MFSVKWNYDYGRMKCIYNGDWKPLGRCSAAIARTIETSDKGYVTESFYFMSYATPIMVINNIKSDDGKVLVSNVFVNKDAYGCSNSTIRQTSKFLTYVNAFFIVGFNYQDIKIALKALDQSQKDWYWLTNETGLLLCSQDKMECLFRRNVGSWSVFSI